MGHPVENVLKELELSAQKSEVYKFRNLILELIKETIDEMRFPWIKEYGGGKRR